MRMLLFDNHNSHTSEEFLALASQHNIITYTFPSHCTHIFQPLDIGVFSSYKHWHNKAIEIAVQAHNSTYDMTAFLGNLSHIKGQTFTRTTITSA